MRAKQTSMRIRSLRRRRLALALVGAMAMPLPALAQSNLPEAGSVVPGSGSATIGQSGNEMTITQTTKGAIIDWGSFNIGAGYGVTFDQQFGASSVTLNRVVGFGYGPSASSINGNLTANGTVFIVNPAGITFGSGAQVNVGGLVASTLELTDSDFLTGLSTGRYRFMESAFGASPIINSGQLIAGDGGTIGLIAPTIINSGEIAANHGSVVFGATRQVTLDFFGDGLTQVTVSGLGSGRGYCQPPYVDCGNGLGGITSSGTISALGGHIEMRTNTMDGLPAQATGLGVDPANGGRIWLSGSVSANTDGSRRGSIVLDAGNGNVDLGGQATANITIGAEGDDPGEDGGEIEISANRLFLRGQNTSTQTGAAQLSVTANTNSGDGGNIVISTNEVHNYNLIRANGGGGGVVEISTRDFRNYGQVSAFGYTSGAGQGGQITVAADTVLLQRGLIPSPYVGANNFTGTGGIYAFGGQGGGEIAITANRIDIRDAGGFVASSPSFEPMLSVDGISTSGGLIRLTAPMLFLDPTATVSAHGEGSGGRIEIDASQLLSLGGLLDASGGTIGGNVNTSASQQSYFYESLVVNAGGGSVAGNWNINVPEAGIVSTDPIVGGLPIHVLTDGALSNALNNNTSINLSATNGSITIGADVDVLRTSGLVPVVFNLNAASGITGAGFSVMSSSGELGLGFQASAGSISFSNSILNSAGGNIAFDGLAPSGVGIVLDGSIVGSGGGTISFDGNGHNSGVAIVGATIDSGGGAISISGNAFALDGVGIEASMLSSSGGDVEITGTSNVGVGVGMLGSIVSTEGGDLAIGGASFDHTGLAIHGSQIDSGAGFATLRAGNLGSVDAIILDDSSVASSLGVALNPTNTADEILVGGGTAGFALSGAELAMIDTPQLVIGSNLHAGAIRVLGATSRAGNLTLQNDGGSGGIDIQAALDVGGGVLALSSGGDITQSAAGAITAHSLLARAGGDVLLANANNNVAATTLAGTAGGDFEYQDVDALAIGTVSASGFDASANGLSSLAANGISAGGDVFVRNLAGDMILNAGVSGTDIDLVTANTLQNLAGASLVASGDWRVWANTWVGETRGGLAGDGNLPNLYGCTFLGQCVVSVPSVDNHFIYVQQPTAVITFDDFTREYGLPNPVFTFTVSGAILGDSAANVATGTGTTTATIGSNVGNYSITGNFASAAGYVFQFVPGMLGITPAPLLFTATPTWRYMGDSLSGLQGTVDGLRNGDTESLIRQTNATSTSIPGFYSIYADGSLSNYSIVQAPGNATALQIIPRQSTPPPPPPPPPPPSAVIGCLFNVTANDVTSINASGDDLARQWLEVGAGMELNSCIDSQRQNSCRF